MSTLLDSKPVFLARLHTSGVHPDIARDLAAGGIDTLARFAFGSAAQPGTGDEAPFIELLTRVLQKTVQEIGVDNLASLRRVWYECSTIAVAELRQKVEQTGESAPKKIPVPERAARLEAQQRRLFGLRITAQLEPSYQLCDAVNQMKDDEQLRWISPETCTSRESELGGVKKEAFIAKDVASLLKQVEHEVPGKADVSNEYRARLALTRRSLALDQSDLMPFSVMEEYHDYLYDLVMLEVPNTHQSINLQQVLLADKMIWARMSSYCRAGISRRPDGSLPIENALDQARRHPVVVAMLQPLPKSGKGRGKQTEPGKPGKGAGANKKPAAPADANPAPKAKAKAKAKGQSKGALPAALRGCYNKTAEGSNICFAFNLPDGCTATDCRKGKHVCAGCLSGSHGYQTCTA